MSKKLSRADNEKRQQQLEHFKKRCEQRLGFIPSQEERRALAKAIQAKQTPVVVRQSKRSGIYLATLREIKVHVNFDHEREQLVSIWPADSIKKLPFSI
jgi:hypothetical protein